MRRPKQRDKQSSRFPRFFICLFEKRNSSILGIVLVNKNNRMNEKKLLNLEPQWRLPNDLSEEFKTKCDKSITNNWMVLRRKLKQGQIATFYLNELGLTIQQDNLRVNKSTAKYMWARLDGYLTEKQEQLYAWMYRMGNGGYHNFSFGTRYEFDAFVVGHLPIPILDALRNSKEKEAVSQTRKNAKQSLKIKMS